jgi:hypothetical protein
MFGIELAGGAVVFAAFLVVFLIAVMYALYSRAGSGIGQHPYRHVHGGAPGAAHECRMSGSPDREILTWSRGTR